MPEEYAITNDKTKRPVALRTKTLADLLESFIAALYIDKDLEYVHTFMNVCFFPRLKEFILNQDWNDPKSQLQQCCLTLRTEGKEPDIPLYNSGSHLVFVPSLRDVHHEPVYPQPPFTFSELSREDKKRVQFVSEPCSLSINGVMFGLTSTDLLFHIGAEEIFSSSGTSDRFSRVLKHILTQRSYYPLYPPHEDMAIDYENFYTYAQLPVTPDVFIVPSELRYFVKDIFGCVCVNPGRLTKGQVGGTFGRLYLRRQPKAMDGGGRQGLSVAAQVVRI